MCMLSIAVSAGASGPVAHCENRSPCPCAVSLGVVGAKKH